MNAFLAGAQSRLLPASVPFRFFATAVVCHVLAWLALAAGARDFAVFTGGLGWPLAALHLVTLGVLAMTALGASLQLLPVATRQPMRWPRAVALLWWLFTAGVAATTLGMGLVLPALLASGAVVVIAALVLYAGLLARNLSGARGMRVVVAHGWVALASLVIVVATALSLAGAYVGIPVLARSTALALHVTFAVYGFMGMLAIGLSYVLVPMFALAPPPDARRASAALVFAASALALAGIAALGVAPRALRIGAIGAATIAVALHLRLMRVALSAGMRRELGSSFRLVRLAWGCLAASLVAALAVAIDAPVRGIGALFGLLVIGGWLLTFVLGILQRIVPFLAAMHASGTKPRSPTPSSLTATRPLEIHGACHVVALALLAFAAVLQSEWIAAAGAVAGAAGAASFAVFYAAVHVRLRRALATAKAHELKPA